MENRHSNSSSDKRRSIGRRVAEDVISLQKDFKYFHKFLYVMCIFIGVILSWYGAWNIVAMIPVLKNPFVATVCGMVILAGTGTLFKELV